MVRGRTFSSGHWVSATRNMMDRDYFYKIMYGEGNLDYELYLNTAKLLRCQKDFSEFCNKDELQFEVVQQLEARWMKLIAWALLDIEEYISVRNTNRVLTTFKRVQMA